MNEINWNIKDLQARRGRFTVSEALIEMSPLNAVRVLSTVIVYDVKRSVGNDWVDIEYFAMSPLFAAIAPGGKVPEYSPQLVGRNGGPTEVEFWRRS